VRQETMMQDRPGARNAGFAWLLCRNDMTTLVTARGAAAPGFAGSAILSIHEHAA